jgi:small-conductance mechanosensitive channel
MRILIVVLTVLTSLASMPAAHAQLTSLLPAKPVKPAPANSQVTVSDPKQELADAQARLTDAQTALKRLQSDLNKPGLAPSVRQDLLQQFNLRQTLTDRYAEQVGYLKQMAVLDVKIVDAKQARDNWTAPAGTPPWSVVDGDTVRNEMQAVRVQIAQLDKELASGADQLVGLGQEKAVLETKIRQLQERAANASEADRQQLTILQDRLALLSAVLLRTDLERRVKEKERSIKEIHLDMTKRTWQYYDGRFELTPDVLEKAKADLQMLIDRSRDLELKALAKSEAATARMNLAQSGFMAIEQNGSDPLKVAQARSALDVAQAEEAAARSEVDRLRRMIEIGGYGLQIWDARATIYATPRPDAATLEELAQRVKTGMVRVRQARDLLQESLTNKEQQAFDLRESLLTAKSELDRKSFAARLKAATTETDNNRLVLSAIDRFDQYLQVLQSELGSKEKGRTIAEQAVAYWQRAVAIAKSVWQYELFTVDDSVVADGKEIKTTRSVTVGKSVGAIGILVLGFFLISGLIRASLGLAERRLGLKSSAATIIRRWLTVLATGTLIVLSFNLVQIPLSVFAFLGGALAIGAGFGTQNLLKNLISGVMLLVERPIRIGDLVEIDNVRGRVTSIGIRFSTIHNSDGIDTLIPNSELVEKKLTNWTFSNPDVRREIRVGVAYGADPVQVKNLMQCAAKEHPDVMPTPEPMVVLDDLGDSALIFTLRYWIRIESGTDGRRVDSDLRCEILEKLNAAGIAVPYPQRDIRLSAAEPLPVAVVASQQRG